MDRPSSPCVVARLAAACRIARRLSTPSARGFRPVRLPRSGWPDVKSWSLILDIIARSVVLFIGRSPPTWRSEFMSAVDRAARRPAPDFAAVKSRQQSTWASGDFAVVASRIVFQAEHLCETADLQAGWRVLDVATGSGNA